MNWRFWQRKRVSPSQLRYEREKARIKAHSYRTTEIKMSPPESVTAMERQL